MRAFTDLIGSPNEDQISLPQRTDHLYEVIFGCAFFDIDPLRGPIFHSNDEHPLTRAHDARAGDEQNGLVRVYRPPDRRIHSSSEAAVGIRDIQLHWHRTGFRINGSRYSSYPATKHFA